MIRSHEFIVSLECTEEYLNPRAWSFCCRSRNHVISEKRPNRTKVSSIREASGKLGDPGLSMKQDHKRPLRPGADKRSHMALAKETIMASGDLNNSMVR